MYANGCIEYKSFTCSIHCTWLSFKIYILLGLENFLQSKFNYDVKKNPTFWFDSWGLMRKVWFLMLHGVVCYKTGLYTFQKFQTSLKTIKNKHQLPQCPSLYKHIAKKKQLKNKQKTFKNHFQNRIQSRFEAQEEPVPHQKIACKKSPLSPFSPEHPPLSIPNPSRQPPLRFT